MLKGDIVNPQDGAGSVFLRDEGKVTEKYARSAVSEALRLL